MTEPFLTASEVASLLKINVETVYTLIRTSGLPAAKVGSQWRLMESEVRRWVQAQTQDSLRSPSSVVLEPSDNGYIQATGLSNAVSPDTNEDRPHSHIVDVDTRDHMKSR